VALIECNCFLGLILGNSYAKDLLSFTKVLNLKYLAEFLYKPSNILQLLSA
jgi:hypothetical protein